MKPTFILHRVNSLAELSALESAWGAEIDLRSSPATGRLHLSHDPFKEGTDFEQWLTAFAQKKAKGPLILNTKEDGLESKILELLKAARVDNFFFLDTALPTLVKHALRGGASHFAVRVSSVEPLEGLHAFAGKVKWAWVDCFNAEPLAPELVAQVRARFKVCLVSPELQGGDAKQLEKFQAIAALADAICTKVPRNWEPHFGK